MDRTYLEQTAYRQKSTCFFCPGDSSGGEFSNSWILPEMIEEILAVRRKLNRRVKQETLRRIAAVQEAEGDEER